MLSAYSIGCLSIISVYMVWADNVQSMMFISTVSIFSASCLFIVHIYVFIGQDVHLLLFKLTQNNVSNVIVYLLILIF